MTEYEECLNWLRSMQQAEVEKLQQGIHQNPFWMQLMTELQELHATTIFLFQNNEEFRNKFLDLYCQRSQVNKLTDEETKNLLRSILANKPRSSESEQFKGDTIELKCAKFLEETGIKRKES